MRVCDAGGWTDTWFAGHGVVCSLAVRPGAHVRATPGGDAPVSLVVGATGERYGFDPSVPGPGRHPLLEAVVAAAPPPTPYELSIGASVPPGSGTGTSAAVVVALVAALRALRHETIDAHDLATRAHAIETGLGWQSGVQDQHAAAHGGVLLIEVDYPRATVHSLDVAATTRAELDRRLLTVWLGHPHRSSLLHEQVIAKLTPRDAPVALEPLRRAARAAADALAHDDLDAYGAALIENTEQQAALDERLVGPDARAGIDVARSHGAVGWKVNGAGGSGGTLSVIGPADPARHDLLARALGAIEQWTILDLRLSEQGLQLDQSAGRSTSS
ncbi:MAG: GHMP kinase [Acidimicrobiia bacterium]